MSENDAKNVMEMLNKQDEALQQVASYDSRKNILSEENILDKNNQKDQPKVKPNRNRIIFEGLIKEKLQDLPDESKSQPVFEKRS